MNSPKFKNIQSKQILIIIAIAACWLLAMLVEIRPAMAEEQLGRLFFTPQQRAQLDFSHARNATSEGSASPVLTVNGIVQKQGGARTVWINGVAQSANTRHDRNPASQTVKVPGKSRAIKLKVGDKILLEQTPADSQAGTGNQP